MAGSFARFQVAQTESLIRGATRTADNNCPHTLPRIPHSPFKQCERLTWSMCTWQVCCTIRNPCIKDEHVASCVSLFNALYLYAVRCYWTRGVKFEMLSTQTAPTKALLRSPSLRSVRSLDTVDSDNPEVMEKSQYLKTMLPCLSECYPLTTADSTQSWLVIRGDQPSHN